MHLSDFSVLTFDCYGTLIDWETGLLQALAPLLDRLPQPVPAAEALETFARHESAQQVATPAMRYDALLTVVHGRLAAAWGVAPSAEEAAAFGASVPDWPAFPDSADALSYLKRHYELVILSNVHRAGFAASNQRLGVVFDAILTAEDIGSYKPDPANFDVLLRELAGRGFAPARVLHTAQSLFHDHVPARRAGLATAWIDRRAGDGWGATMPVQEGAGYDFRFPSLAAMADAHRAEQGG